MISVAQMLNKIMQLSEKPAEIPIKRKFVLMKFHHRFGRCQSCEVTLDKIRAIYITAQLSKAVFSANSYILLINLSTP